MNSSISPYAYFSLDDLAAYPEINNYRQLEQLEQKSLSVPTTSAPSYSCCPTIHVRPSSPIPAPLSSPSTSDYPSMEQQQNPMVLHDNDILLPSPALSYSSSSYGAEQDMYLSYPFYPSSMLQASLPPITTSTFPPQNQQPRNQNQYPSNTQEDNSDRFYWDDFELDPSPVVYIMVNTGDPMRSTDHHHHRQQRGLPKIHYCPFCPHTSNRANNMKEHILTHDPCRPRKFSCPHCSKRFARKHDMLRHANSSYHQ